MIKQSPLSCLVCGSVDHVHEFVDSYRTGAQSARVESERWRSFPYAELIARDEASLDLTWLKDESLEDMDNLPSPDVIAREIVEDLTAALAEFEAVAAALEVQLPRRAEP